jgi:hypothetical protein
MKPYARIERALSALWVAAVTVLAIPALLAAFSREPARPIPAPDAGAKPPASTFVNAQQNRNENGNRLRESR